MNTKSLSMIFSLCVCLMLSNIFASDPVDATIQQKPEKFYVDPQNIKIEGNDISVYLDQQQEWVSTSALLRDAHGNLRSIRFNSLFSKLLPRWPSYL